MTSSGEPFVWPSVSRELDAALGDSIEGDEGAGILGLELLLWELGSELDGIFGLDGDDEGGMGELDGLDGLDGGVVGGGGV